MSAYVVVCEMGRSEDADYESTWVAQVESSSPLRASEEAMDGLSRRDLKRLKQVRAVAVDDMPVQDVGWF